MNFYKSPLETLRYRTLSQWFKYKLTKYYRHLFAGERCIMPAAPFGTLATKEYLPRAKIFEDWAD